MAKKTTEVMALIEGVAQPVLSLFLEWITRHCEDLDLLRRAFVLQHQRLEEERPDQQPSSMFDDDKGRSYGKNHDWLLDRMLRHLAKDGTGDYHRDELKRQAHIIKMSVLYELPLARVRDDRTINNRRFLAMAFKEAERRFPNGTPTERMEQAIAYLQKADLKPTNVRRTYPNPNTFANKAVWARLAIEHVRSDFMAQEPGFKSLGLERVHQRSVSGLQRLHDDIPEEEAVAM